MKTQMIHVSLAPNSYDIALCPGLLAKASEHFQLDRQVLIVTDSGVPQTYARALALQCRTPFTVTLPQGEASKSFENLELLCRTMLDLEFDRTACVVAVGGGVVGDLAGFAASIYMRGIDFYNVPTTLLSQVDSSIGGKTAVDLDGIKNVIGTFYQPKGVLIDPTVLQTLSPRHIANGMAEVVKMALTFDQDLFTFLEQHTKSQILQQLQTVIAGALTIKKNVVEQDEKEAGLRRVLNFGHTIGHGLESAVGLQNQHLHGECVALGMLPMCDKSVRERLIPVLQKLDLPTTIENYSPQAVREAMSHDKKHKADGIHVILCHKVGSYEIEKRTIDELQQMLIQTFPPQISAPSTHKG